MRVAGRQHQLVQSQYRAPASTAVQSMFSDQDQSASTKYAQQVRTAKYTVHQAEPRGDKRSLLSTWCSGERWGQPDGGALVAVAGCGTRFRVARQRRGLGSPRLAHREPIQRIDERRRLPRQLIGHADNGKTRAQADTACVFARPRTIVCCVAYPESPPARPCLVIGQ
jgi:hypothetical protein